MNGYVKLHRSINEWEWKTEPNTLAVYIHLLINACFKEHKWKGIILKPGQLVTGRDVIAFASGVSVRSVRTALERLQATNEITIKSTKRGSLITIANWELYQGDDEKATSKTTNKTTLKMSTKRPDSDLTTTNTEECIESKKGCSGGGFLTESEMDAANNQQSEIERVFQQAVQIGIPDKTSDLLRCGELVDEYTAVLVSEAIRKAGDAPASARSWRYIQGVLKGMKRDGGITDRPTVPSQKRLEEARTKLRLAGKHEEAARLTMNDLEVFNDHR
jgi:hypothetical protein